MRFAAPLTAFLLAASLAQPARADFYIVAQADNHQTSLTRKQVVDLFMGRSRSFPDGSDARVLDLRASDPERAAFYEALTGLGMAQVNSYWSRLLFSGRNSPPQQLASEAEMAATLRRTPSAVGWLSHEPTDHALRTLLVVKEAP